MELQEYMAELSRVRPLEKEEERTLWAAFRTGDRRARQTLIESYQPLVFKQAMAFRTHPAVMDLVQEGTVGLIEAVERYDPSRGVAFSLYAMHRIRGRMLNFLDREGRAGLACLEGQSEDGVSLLDTLADDAPTAQELAEDHEMLQRVRGAMDRLPVKEKAVLEGIYLESHGADEVAQTLELSVSHIYRLQKSGVRRVRGMLSRFLHHWS